MATCPSPHAEDLLDIDPDEIMAGSPFAIPPSPGQSGKVLAVAMEQGDLTAFLAAIALIFALVSALGVSLLPGL
ncbi:MAG: hypothetical protein EON47_06340 [Acetobacteraceae bacterium]|nr:MAG: hypothetical protein EON47_06340 [Acetobacteraceae bacterium]